MAFRSSRDRLEDMQDGMLWIERLAADRSLDDYRRDRPLRDAIERNLERISEASRHLPKTMKDDHPTIPWIDVATIGNRLRHGYHAIDHAIIWGIVEHDLPVLREVVQRLLDGLDEEDPG